MFIVDDVAFNRPEHGDAIAAELERRRIRKQHYLETRAPGTEIWYTESRRLDEFYRELGELPRPPHVLPNDRRDLYIHTAPVRHYTARTAQAAPDGGPQSA